MIPFEARVPEDPALITSETWTVLTGVAVALVVAWATLVVFLILARPKSVRLKEIVRVLPDTLRLLRRLAVDSSLPRGVRVRLWLLFVYLAIPFDIVPDFIPVIGYADDAIIVAVVLRSVVRRAGPEAVRRLWPGTEVGLEALWRAARLPGQIGSVPGSGLNGTGGNLDRPAVG